MNLCCKVIVYIFHSFPKDLTVEGISVHCMYKLSLKVERAAGECKQVMCNFQLWATSIVSKEITAIKKIAKKLPGGKKVK